MVQSHEKIEMEHLKAVAQVAVNRYNSIFATSYDLSQISLLLTSEEDMCEINTDKLPPEQATELIIRFPDYEPPSENPTTPPDISYGLYQKAKEKLKQNDIVSANYLIQYIPKIGSELIEKSAYAITSMLNASDPSDNFINKQVSNLSINELIKLCEKFSDNEIIFRTYLCEVARRNINLALVVVFRTPSMLSLLPELCKTEKTFNSARQQMIHSCIDHSYMNYFADIFANKGCFDQAFRIGYDLVTITNASDEFVYNLVWKLLVGFELPKAHQVLLIYFSTRKHRFVGKYSYALFECILREAFSPFPKKRPTFDSPTTVIPVGEAHRYCCALVLCVAIINLYMGFNDRFVEVCKLIDEQMEAACSGPQLPILKIFRGYIHAIPARHTHAPTFEVFYAVCDKSVLLKTIDDCPMPGENRLLHIHDCSIHDIVSPNLSLAKTAFWNLIKQAPGYKGLILMLGYRDLKRVLPRMLQYGMVTTVEQGLKAIADAYSLLLNQIHEKFPKLRLYVYEVVTARPQYYPVVAALNGLLATGIPGFAKFVSLMYDEEEEEEDSEEDFGPELLGGDIPDLMKSDLLMKTLM